MFGLQEDGGDLRMQARIGPILTMTTMRGAGPTMKVTGTTKTTATTTTGAAGRWIQPRPGPRGWAS
jgi:hypothetical protein